MGRIAIEGVTCLDGLIKTIVLEKDLIEEVFTGKKRGLDSDRTIDGKDLLAMPGLCNSHSHAPMSLLKGIGEDMELDNWLREKIWPMEARMELEHLRSGLELACLEMIRTGTTLFNDMYFRQGEVADVVHNMGLRAVLGDGFIDLFNEDRREDQIKAVKRSLEGLERLRSERIIPSIAPHAVYTVSEEAFQWCGEEAERRDITLHVHISETLKEVDDCRKMFNGTPMEILNSYGVLNERVLGAHCVHLNSKDMDLARSSGMTIAHVPVSNMKLSVGGQLRFPVLRERGIPITLGTDGSASNNSLDMFSSMKTMGLLCKQSYGAASITAAEIIASSTNVGYEAFRLDGGKLEEGKLADIILIDMKDPSMVPCHDPASNVVYSLNGNAVKYTIVAGRLIMDDGFIEGEKEIIERAVRLARDLGSG